MKLILSATALMALELTSDAQELPKSIHYPTDRVQFVNVWNLWKESPSDELSSSDYYVDAIHLNSAGYDLFFNEQQINDFICPSSDSSDTLLIFGDSWAQYAAQANQPKDDLCAGNLTVVNYGIGGTTAAQWASGGDIALSPLLAALFNVPQGTILSADIAKSFERAKNQTGTTPTKVWMTIGGNDILGADQCEPDTTELHNNIASALDQVLSADPNVQVLVTGYGSFSRTNDLFLTYCNNITKMESLNNNAFVEVLSRFQDPPPSPSAATKTFVGLGALLAATLVSLF